MEKQYQPHKIETKWAQKWEAENYFTARGKGAPYSIVIPPPNVTGRLHMGHGFQNTLMDALIRFHRMDDNNTLWQVGTDHAGIATQMIVERKLQEENKSRHDLGRETFIKRIWEWKAESGGYITQQMRRLGSSVDWSRECFTMDENLSATVLHTFEKLYDEGLIYRGERLVNWDPVLHTAISDLEVISEETEGQLWHIRYPLADSDASIEIATTRPETLLGDTAIAVHPNDDRYQHLVGKEIMLPLCERRIPIIADHHVDPDFGSGCVKITPAHDFNDYAIGKRHNLPLINIMTKDAHINDNAPKAYQGLERFAARKKIIADLQQANLLVKIVKHNLKIPRGDRTNAVIEPMLTQQWFVKTQPLAEPAIAAVKDGEIKFVPENWSRTYFQWMENIEDWCISRQLWWGHRIPAWYDESGQIYVGKNEQHIREKYQLSSDLVLRQDSDVLDTWFSSALWPFSTLGWLNDQETFNTFYPTNVLVTGFDIIFFWVARMIMMGLKFTGKIPFKEVYITGLIRDKQGKKMSKSKGNILDPIDLIDGIELDALIKKRTAGLMQLHLRKSIEIDTRKEFPQGIAAHGTDALRFTYCALASTGRDIRFEMNRLEGYRNFCNKLWNASRYVLMNIEDKTASFEQAPTQLSLVDRWITTKLNNCISEVRKHFINYRFDLIANALYEFTWSEYCDWYLEFSKAVLYDDSASATTKYGMQYTLINVLEILLRLLHPIIPFISEEIWQRVAAYSGNNAETIMLQSYPRCDTQSIDNAACEQLDWLKQIITAIRTIRAEMNIAPSKTISVMFYKATAVEIEIIKNNNKLISNLSKLNQIEFLTADDSLPQAATAIVNNMEILIPMQGLIDKNAELNRLAKEIEKLNKDLERSQKKLQNPNYVDKAPATVVNKERERVKNLKNTVSNLIDKRIKISAL